MKDIFVMVLEAVILQEAMNILCSRKSIIYPVRFKDAQPFRAVEYATNDKRKIPGVEFLKTETYKSIFQIKKGGRKKYLRALNFP